MNNGGPREIQMVITFHLGVCVRPRIYRDAKKRTMEALREIQTVITFHFDVRLKRMIYRDTRN